MHHLYLHNTLSPKSYVNINDAPVSDLLRQGSIKTENHFMALSDSSCQDFPDTGRSTGAYIIFNQGETVDHGFLQHYFHSKQHCFPSIKDSFQYYTNISN